MGTTHTERQQIENELIFRQSNEKVAEALDKLDARHINEGNIDLTRDEDLALHFKCECSDENCSIRIPMLVSEYQKIHTNRLAFIVVPGHEVSSIEKVIRKSKDFNVVKKKHVAVKAPDTLNTTDTNNV